MAQKGDVVSYSRAEIYNSGFESGITQLVALPDENNGFYQISEVTVGLLAFVFNCWGTAEDEKYKFTETELVRYGTRTRTFLLTKCSDMRTEGLLPEILCDTRDIL